MADEEADVEVMLIVIGVDGLKRPGMDGYLDWVVVFVDGAAWVVDFGDGSRRVQAIAFGRNRYRGRRDLSWLEPGGYVD